MKEYTVFFPKEASTEKLPLTSLGKNRYRMEASAFTEEGVYYHDVIEAKIRWGRGLCFLRVAERSGLRVFFFLLPATLTGSELFEPFLQRVAAHGGLWEQIFGGILLVHLPRGSACRPKSEIRAMLRRLDEAAA